jgi:hypothetical protein
MLADVMVGIGLNFNALDQTEYSVAPNQGLGWIFGSGARAPRYPVPTIDGAALNNLVSNEIDFIGISAYAPYSGPGMSLNEFENSAFNVGDSLKTLGNGIDLAALVNSGKLELHYSEFGIGGGNEGNAAVSRVLGLIQCCAWTAAVANLLGQQERHHTSTFFILSCVGLHINQQHLA